MTDGGRREEGTPRCGGPGGKEILPTKEAARSALLSFRAKYGATRGKSYRCAFGDHYHVTTGTRGRPRKGK